MSLLNGFDPSDVDHWGVPDSIVQKTIELERIRFARELIISRYEVERLDLDEMRRELVLRASCDLVGMKHVSTQETSIMYPADWWEALKDRFAPEWFLKRWPVRQAIRKVRFEVDCVKLFPQIALPACQKNITLVLRENVKVSNAGCPT